MEQQPAITAATAEELTPALRLLFRNLDADERDTRIATVLKMIAQREFDPVSIFVERVASRIEGVIICQALVGATALIWPPQVHSFWGRRETEDRLVAHALDWLKAKQTKLVQALLAPADLAQGESLLRHDFRHITTLIYLRHDLDLPIALFLNEERLTYRPYDPLDPEVFHRTLERTYDGTLDCPEVNDVRTIDEVMAGHKAQGRHDPGRWWLAFVDETPVGVLMLTEFNDGSGWDLSYLGVIPEWRGRGVGRELTVKALLEARAAEARNLSLAVDRRNMPAWNLYRKVGFDSYDMREVFLAVQVQPKH